MIANNREFGVAALGPGTALDASNLNVESTINTASDGTGGLGISVQAGARLILHKSAMTDNPSVGLSVAGAGTTAEISELLISNSFPATAAKHAIEVRSGAVVVMSDVSVQKATEVGILVDGNGSAASGKRVLVTGTTAIIGSHVGGTGVAVAAGGTIDLEQSLITNNTDFGLLLDGFGSNCVLKNSTVSNTTGSLLELLPGAGVQVRYGSRLVIDNSAIINNHGGGATIGFADSLMTGTSVLVSDSQPSLRTKEFGSGIVIQSGARLDGSDVTVRNNRTTGVFAAGDGTTVSIERLFVDGTLPDAATQENGRGIGIQEGASAILRNAVVRRSHDIGVYAAGVLTTLDARGFVIRDTHPQASDGRFGDGLLVASGASLSGGDLTLWDNARCGIQLAFEGISLNVQDALIGRNLFGTNLQSSDFTRQNLADNLRGEVYWENGVDIGSEALEVPDPMDAIGSLGVTAP